MSLRAMLFALCALTLSGCAERYAARNANSRGEAPASMPAGSMAGVQDYDEASSKPARKAVNVVRKIIYTADVTLTVERLPAAEKALLEMVHRHHGYVASTDVAGAPGAPRSGTWKLRVPVTEFEAFRKELEGLGELQRMHLDSQDVTDEYYDVEANISNKRVEETRLLEHLRKSTGTLADILAVEQELSRVRGEIEQLQGRLRLLANQTELTTITVAITEAQEFVPIRGTSFGAEAARTFRGSLSTLKQAAQGLLLVVIAVLPWLLVIAVIVAPVVVLLRRLSRR